jgi:tetratricopeptide (TPR) repeat protein
MDELVDALLEEASGDEVWTRVAALELSAREQLVDGLKERVDRLVRSDPPAALAAAEVLMRAADGVPSRRAIALRGHGAAHHINGHAEQALADYEAAAGAHAEAGQELEEARVRRSMVDVLQMAGRAEDALEQAGRARAAFEAAGEERLLAQLDVNVGNVHFRLDEYARAREAYRSARDRFAALEDPLGLAFAQFNLGNLENTVSNFDEAERSYAAARSVFEEAGMAVHSADCDYSLAEVEARRGRWAEAVRGFEAVRTRYEEVGKPSGVPLCDLDLAELHLRLDAWRDALASARAAADRFAELGLEYEQARADVLSGLARARLGEAAAARDDLERARGAFRMLGNKTFESFAAIQAHAARTAAGDAAGALGELQDAAEHLTGAGNTLLAELATVALARALVECGDADGALEALAPLRDEESGRGGLDDLVRSEASRLAAAALRTAGRPEEALHASRRAVALIEDSYARVPGTDARVAFFRDRHGAFVELALALLEEDPASGDEALDLLERSRMRTSAALRTDGGDDDAVRAAREHLDGLLGRRLDGELGALSGEEGGPRPPTDGELLGAQRALQDLAAERGLEPAGGTRHFSEAERAAAVRGDELLVAYLLDDRGARAFLVEPGGVRAVPLGVTPRDVADAQDRLGLQLGKFRLGTAYGERHAARLRASTDRILGALGEQLLGPIAGELDGRPLTIVPWGPLHALPFHALRLGDRYLVETNEVSTAPSAALLAQLRGRAQGSEPLTVCSAGVAEESAPAIAAELAAMERIFGGALERAEPEALAGRLRAGGGRGVLHLAAHGTYRPEHPVFSGLRLGRSFLTAWDVRRAANPFDLVALSGCETGRRYSIAGEELLGPAQAFLAAGARAVVASGWTLGDADSAACMERFFTRFAAGESARAALAGAQRELAAERPHPFAWAPFSLAGDPDVRTTPR